MILKSVYVSSFGNLKNYSLDFSRGVNVVIEDNGFGKSTLATFIKSMFYGLADGTRSVATNERLKYKPWNSTEKFGGNIVFEFKGNNYKIERYFGNKAAEDTLKLFDADTGKEHTKTENLGFRLFDIDESGFFSTTFLSQNDLGGKGNDSITAKLNSNELENGENAVALAIKKLEEKTKKYKNFRGGDGIIADLKRAIYLKEEEIDKAKTSLNTVTDLKSKLAELTEKEDALKNECELLTKQLEESSKAEARKVKADALVKYKAEVEKRTAEESAFNGTLKGYEISNDELSALKESVSAVYSSAMKKEGLEREIRNTESTIEEKSAKKLPIYPFVICLILAVLGGVLVPTVNVLLGTIIIALGVMAAAVYVVLFIKSSKKTVVKENPKLTELNAALSETTRVYEEYKSALDNFFSRFNLNEGNYDYRYEILRSAKAGRDSVRKVKAELLETISKLEGELATEKEDKNAADSYNLRLKVSEKREELRAVSAERSSIETRIIYNEESAAKLPILEEERDELTERFNQANEEYGILKLTTEYLKSADEDLKKRFKAPLQESLDKYIYYLSGGKIKANIDVDLKVSIENDGKTYDADYMSQGYKNLIEICKRFALSEVIFKEEKPFMMLDDPFTNLDKTKIDLGAELLEKLSKEFQIIYFTCHESRALS